MNLLKYKQLPRFLISAGFLVLYGLDHTNQFNQTLATLVGFYWLGSSAGSALKDERHVNAAS